MRVSPFFAGKQSFRVPDGQPFKAFKNDVLRLATQKKPDLLTFQHVPQGEYITFKNGEPKLYRTMALLHVVTSGIHEAKLDQQILQLAKKYRLIPLEQKTTSLPDSRVGNPPKWWEKLLRLRSAA